MTHDDSDADYRAWIARRAAVTVPDGFTERVLERLPGAPPPRAGDGAGPRPLAWRLLATPTGRAAAVLAAVAACAFRVFHLLDLFLV